MTGTEVELHEKTAFNKTKAQATNSSRKDLRFLFKQGKFWSMEKDPWQVQNFWIQKMRPGLVGPDF